MNESSPTLTFNSCVHIVIPVYRSGRRRAGSNTPCVLASRADRLAGIRRRRWLAASRRDPRAHHGLRQRSTVAHARKTAAFPRREIRDRSFHQRVDYVHPLPCSTRPDWPRAGSHDLDIAVWLGAIGIAASSFVEAGTRIVPQEFRTLHRN